MPDPAPQPVRVWDLPTRLFHWVLALTIVGSVVSAAIGGDAMRWHFRCGYVVFTLLAFRLLWGVVGGRWSRFGSFVYAPATTLRYLRGDCAAGEHVDVGHNPLGSLSVFALLLLLALQVGSGLVADDEIANVGPLNRYVAGASALAATAWHKGWGRALVLVLIALHVAAILYYRWGREIDLVRPMLHGDKPLPAGTPASADGTPQRLMALALVAGCAAAVAWIVGVAG